MIYDLKYIKETGKKSGISREQKFSMIISLFDFNEKVVLDIGSGDLQFANTIAPMCKEIYCYDIAYRKNKLEVEKLKEHANIILISDLDDLQNRNLDTVTMIDFVEHIYFCELKNILLAIDDNLSIHTKILIKTPARYNLFVVFGKRLASHSFGHVNVRASWELNNFFKKFGMEQQNYKIFTSGLTGGLVRKLPYPLCELFGGHYFQVYGFKKRG